MATTLRILMSAYACEPGKGSEPGFGWDWARQAARFHDVWVITRARNRAAIEQALAREPMPRARFVYFDLPRWARFWKKGRRGVHVYYYLWQIGIYFIAARLHKTHAFDLVQHVTVASYWKPSFLFLLPAPFVWGPLGGGESAPRHFRRLFGFRAELYELLRDLARAAGSLDPFVRLTAARAQVAFGLTPETAGRLTRLGSRNVSVLCRTSLPADEIAALGRIAIRTGRPFRVVSIGRLLHWKGFSLGMEAFATFHREIPNGEYWFIGDGPERRSLERLAARLGVAERVKFLGSLSRSETLTTIAECDALLHPSLHDSFGWVCIEAMAAGRPVLCLDLSGPAMIVSDEAGIRVPALSPRQAVEGLALALTRLAACPGLKEEMGRAARTRVQQHFNRDSKGDLWSPLLSSRPLEMETCR